MGCRPLVYSGAVGTHKRMVGGVGMPKIAELELLDLGLIESSLLAVPDGRSLKEDMREMVGKGIEVWDSLPGTFHLILTSLEQRGYRTVDVPTVTLQAEQNPLYNEEMSRQLKFTIDLEE